ncbi:MAG: MBL fold metallo-hydrolase [Elusimicrobiota bacterium]
MSLYLRQLEVGPMKNFQYLVGDSETKKCWYVDPAWEVETVLKRAEEDGFSVEGALISHAHYDHCNALDKLLAARDVPVYVQEREVSIAEKAAQTGIFGFLPKENVKIVKSGDTLSSGSTRLTFLHTPGHTPGSQCFLVEGNLLAGDTLFLGTCGRCDLPGGNPHELFQSLNGVLSKLPDQTVVYPGHDYSAEGTSRALGEEKTKNRFFRANTLEDFLAMLGL